MIVWRSGVWPQMLMSCHGSGSKAVSALADRIGRIEPGMQADLIASTPTRVT
jgi:predicted amidohydrolase YtcJ